MRTEFQSVLDRKAERMKAWREENPREAWALDHLEGWYKPECIEAVHADLVDEGIMADLAMIADQLEDAFRGSDEGLIRCVSCNRAATYSVDVIMGVAEGDEDREMVGQVMEVMWVCQVCEGKVCRWCAFRDPQDGLVLHDNTYCGEGCWKADGSPLCG